MLRRILAVAAGVVVFLAVVALLDGLASVLFPAPPSIETNADAIPDQMPSIPLGALVIVLAGSTLAAFGGSYVTGMLGGAGVSYWPYVTGAIGLAATVTNALSLPHPLWFVVAAPVGVIGATVLGAWLSGRNAPGPRKVAPAPPPRQAARR
ncbi:MAG: hypothetical protein ACT4P6_14865 [Gemmatimonadaceae bacterium]